MEEKHYLDKIFDTLNNEFEIIEALEKSAAFQENPAVKTPFGLSVLHIAAWENMPIVIGYVLFHQQNKINVDIENSEGETALHFAIERNHLLCARVLLNYGANLLKKDCNNVYPIFNCLPEENDEENEQNKKSNCLQEILRKLAFSSAKNQILNCQNQLGLTPYQMACELGSEKAISLFWKYLENPFFASHYLPADLFVALYLKNYKIDDQFAGQSLIQFAVQTSHIILIKLVLLKKPKLDYLDQNQNTLLHLFCQRFTEEFSQKATGGILKIGHFRGDFKEIFQLFCNSGIDESALNHDEKKARDYLQFEKLKSNYCNILKELGCDVKITQAEEKKEKKIHWIENTIFTTRDDKPLPISKKKRSNQLMLSQVNQENQSMNQIEEEAFGEINQDNKARSKKTKIKRQKTVGKDSNNGFNFNWNRENQSPNPPEDKRSDNSEKKFSN